MLLTFLLLLSAFAHADFKTYEAGSIATPCIYVPPGREHWARANCGGVSRAGDLSAPMQFNSEGLRDKDYPARPAKGTFRVLYFGSSNVLGVGLPEPATTPRQLELRLRAKGIRAEVINAAMLGYCTIQTAFRFRDLLERYHPQLVVYQLVQGTCPLVDGAWSDRVKEENGAPVAFDRSPFRGTLAFLNPVLFRHPSLFFLWLTVADQMKKVRLTLKVHRQPTEAAKAATLLAPTLKYLGYLQRTARESGSNFLLASFPMETSQQSVPAQMVAPVAKIFYPFLVAFDDVREETLVAQVRSAGFPFLLPNFPSRFYHIPGDVHLDARGNELFAAGVADALLTDPSTRAFLPAPGRK